MGQSTTQLSNQIADTREDLSQNLDALGDKVSPSAIVQRRKTAAKNKLGTMKSRVMGTARDAGQGASGTAAGAAASISSTAQDAVHTAEEQFEGAPLAAGVVAFGLGMIAASLVPPSETETAAAQKAVEAAKEHGQGVIEEAKSTAQEVGEQLKDTATQAAQEVKNTATDSAQTIKDEGQSSAEKVKEQTQQNG